MPLDTSPQIRNLSTSKEGWWQKENRAEQLAILWEAGFTCQQIADKLGTSKNSVIGKARRLDLAMRTDAINPQLTSQKRLESLNGLMPPGGRCRWPSDDPQNPEMFSYCGEKVYDGKSYCLHHFVESVSWEASVRAGVKSRRPQCDCAKCKRKKK
jgi:hypothetical protein